MGKVIKIKDVTYRIRYDSPMYFLEKKVGRWYNKKWITTFKSANKTLFIKRLNTYLV